MEPVAFALRMSRIGRLFVRPLAWGRIGVSVSAERVSIRMGALGGGDVPIRLVDRVGTMTWPWWGGLGVRLGRGLVAFVGEAGECALLELSEPVKLRAPLPWSTQKVVVAVTDLDAFVTAVAAARDGRWPPPA